MNVLLYHLLFKGMVLYHPLFEGMWCCIICCPKEYGVVSHTVQRNVVLYHLRLEGRIDFDFAV